MAAADASPLDPDATSAWLGIRFGALETPSHRLRYLAQYFSDSSFGRTPDGRDAPVSVTIRHVVDGGVVDVKTRRAYDDATTVTDHMWSTLTEFRLADPPADVTNVSEWAQPYIWRPRPPEESNQLLALDGTLVPWQRIADDDLVVLGAGTPGGVLAVAGPAALASMYAVQLLPVG
jgi:hypothetical protein